MINILLEPHELFSAVSFSKLVLEEGFKFEVLNWWPGPWTRIGYPVLRPLSNSLKLVQIVTWNSETLADELGSKIHFGTFIRKKRRTAHLLIPWLRNCTAFCLTLRLILKLTCTFCSFWHLTSYLINSSMSSWPYNEYFPYDSWSSNWSNHWLQVFQLACQAI